MPEPPIPTPAPPAPEPTPSPPAPPAPDPEPEPSFKPVTSQEQFDSMVKERIARERAKFGDYDELKEKASKFDELQESQRTELEKAQARAEKAEQERERVLAEAKETRLHAAIIAEAAKPDRKVADPDAVVLLLDRQALELDDDGTPKNIAQAVDTLLEQRPYLVAQQGGARPGEADQGARGGGQQLTRADLQTMTPDEIEKARHDGRLDSLLKGQT